MIENFRIVFVYSIIGQRTEDGQGSYLGQLFCMQKRNHFSHLDRLAVFQILKKELQAISSELKIEVFQKAKPPRLISKRN